MTSSVAKPITPEDFLSKPDIETLIAVRRDSRRMFDVIFRMLADGDELTFGNTRLRFEAS